MQSNYYYYRLRFRIYYNHPVDEIKADIELAYFSNQITEEQRQKCYEFIEQLSHQYG